MTGDVVGHARDVRWNAATRARHFSELAEGDTFFITFSYCVFRKVGPSEAREVLDGHDGVPLLHVEPGERVVQIKVTQEGVRIGNALITGPVVDSTAV